MGMKMLMAIMKRIMKGELWYMLNNWKENFQNLTAADLLGEAEAAKAAAAAEKAAMQAQMAAQAALLSEMEAKTIRQQAEIDRLSAENAMLQEEIDLLRGRIAKHVCFKLPIS